MSQNATDIRNKLEQLSEDMSLMHRFVQGTDTETVPLGTPPVPTPSVRKLAKDIDARESAKADAVIAGATGRINAEGAAQQARVLAAGETQTARVNGAGDAQHGRVNAEGNAQFGRVNAEGNTQYARVNEAGEAQTTQVNTAGQTQHTAITTTANALLAEMGALGTAKKEDITSTGAAFLLQISANGDAQNTRLTTTGAAEDLKLRATGDAQRIIVILEGDTQVQRLAESGDTLNATLLNLVREAAQSAREAAQSASTAVDMTHVGPAGKGKFGFVRIGSGIDVTEEGEISVAFPAVVSTPAVGFPAVVGIGYDYELSMSAESAVYGARIATFIIAVDEEYVREVPAVNNAATHTLPITGVPGTTGRIVVTAVDDLGNMSLDSVTTFQRNTVTIATPRVLSPVDAATDVSLAPLITVQPMQVSGVPATFEHTQLQISTLEDFSVCVLDTGEDAPYATQHQLADDLQKNTVYHARVRHRAVLYGWSPWSAVSLFETMDCFVDVPVIYAPLHDITDVTLRPTISVAAFTNTGPVDTPTATQIQIARDAAFTDIVAQHDGGYVTTFAPAADLALITPYFTRARHKGARWDWSAWSTATRFTTLNAYTQPAAVTYPANGAVGVPLLATLRVVDFANVGPADTATGTHMQIARDADFDDVVAEYNGDYTVAWTLATMLTKLTTYFVRARHKGKRWGWGQWGAVTAFTSEDAFVRTPTVTAPVNGSTGVALRPTVSFSAFTNAGPVDNAISTHFQVARDAAFTNLIHDSGEGGYVTSWTPGGNLALNSPHYVRVRHKGALWGWSSWSAVVGFTTLNAYVNAPTVTAPANNATGVALRPTITLSGFSNVGPADVGNGTQIQIALDAAFTNVVASYASAYTISWAPGNNLGINTPYFVRARHSGATWGWSAWSGACKFTVMNVYVNPPQVIAPANGATGVGLTPLLQMSQATAVNQVIKSTAFHVATDPGFTNIIAQGPFGDGSQLAYQVPANILAINTLYYVRAWAQGSITDWAHGADVSFRTVNGWVNAPTLTSPTANATVAGDAVYFTSSAFSMSHITDTHVATEFALNKVVNGVESQLWTSGALTGGNLLAFKANIPNFEEGTQYRAYVRHKGNALGFGAWSAGVPIKLNKKLFLIYKYNANGYPKIYTSEDGLRWGYSGVVTSSENLYNASVSDVAASGNGLVVKGFGNRLLQSKDGFHFEVPWTGNIDFANFAGGLFIGYMEADGNRNYTIAAGASLASFANKGRIPFPYPTQAAYGAGKYAFVGAGPGTAGSRRPNYTATTTDLINFTGITQIPGTQAAYWNAVAYGAGRFVACGLDGVWATSTDGVNWSSVSIQNGMYNIVHCVFFKERFIIVGNDGGSNYVIRSSADGLIWVTDKVEGVGAYTTESSMEYTQTRIVLLARNKFFSSTDGRNWLTAECPSELQGTRHLAARG